MNSDGQLDKVVTATDCHDCGGRCVMRLHVRSDVITRGETDDGCQPQYRSCAKGRAIRQLTYSPYRVRYPMKRAGRRGEGRFDRISWDEALEIVAGKLNWVKSTFGPQAILLVTGSGTTGKAHGFGLSARDFFGRFGGCTVTWGSPSAEASRWSSRVTYGTPATGHTRDDLTNSRLVLLWAWNPAVSVSGTNTRNYLAQCKEAGTRIVGVDPVLTDSIAVFADQWIPIRPGTDTAMLLAMAYVITTQAILDQDFLDRHTTGFERFRSYLLGNDDGVPKNPAWAETITGVPAATIETLAREYATTRPAALMPGYGPGRSAYGEQFHRAAAVLTAMTGNIGIHGGNPAGHGFLSHSALPLAANPVEKGRGPALDNSLDAAYRSTWRVHKAEAWDALLRGKAGGYPADFKLLYVVSSNCLNQHLNTNHGVEALRCPDFIVVHDPWMTPTAQFADIVLPADGSLERNEIVKPGYPEQYFIYAHKAIEPLDESMSDRDIVAGLAQKLGISDYPNKSEDQVLREVAALPDMVALPDYEEFRREGVHKVDTKEPLVAFKEQVSDPEHHPFPTPSGKIEIWSQQVADLDDPRLPPMPAYVQSWEGHDAAAAKDYPLQLITVHCGQRANSVFSRVPWLNEILRETVTISKADALARHIADGDMVKVFNDRGEVIVAARVTERIMPGVVKMDQGAAYAPDALGTDLGGCTNVLTRDSRSPAGAFPYNTCLVQVKRLEEGAAKH